LSLTEILLRPYSPARPLVTHYDDATGSRVELSAATLRNWAAKTANWLVEEHDVEPGSRVAVSLPAHWQTAGILLGAWWCGAEVVADAAGAAVAFGTGDARFGAGAGVVAVVSLDPMGRDLRGAVPDGAVDFVAEVRVHGDDFLALAPVPGDTACLAGVTVDDVLAAARSHAADLDLTAGDRILSTVEWSVPSGIRDGLLPVLAAGASLVQVSNPDPALVEKHGEVERVTRTRLAPSGGGQA
jgi:uncharacterized protein (TIGR03089 family)